MFPLLSCREAGSAPASEICLVHFLQHLIRCHGSESLFKRRIASHSNIVIYISGIDNTVVPQRNPQLFLIEGDIHHLRDRFAQDIIAVQTLPEWCSTNHGIGKD